LDLGEDQSESDMVIKEELYEHREGMVYVLIDFTARLCLNQLKLPRPPTSASSSISSWDEETGSNRIEILENALHVVEMTLKTFQANSSSIGGNSVCAMHPVRLELAEDCIRFVHSFLFF
jgi:hypothetical protein